MQLTRWSAAVRVLPVVYPLPLYTVLAAALFHKAWHHPLTDAVGDGGDTPQFMWWLAWVPYACVHGVNPLFTDYMHYPRGVNLLWNTAMTPVGLILGPITVRYGPVLAFNLLETSAVALASWSAYLLFRRTTRRSTAAVVGGLLYGFSPYMVAQSLGHPNLTLAFCPPLILLGLYELFVGQGRPLLIGSGLGLLAAIQASIGEELLATTTLVCIMLIGLAATLRPAAVAPRLRPAALALLACTFTFGLLMVYPLWFQFHGPQRVAVLPIVQDLGGSDALGFIIPTQLRLFAPPQAAAIMQRFNGNLSEWNSYLGLPLILLAVGAGAWLRSNLYVSITVLGALVVAIWSMGPTIHLAGERTLIPTALLALLFLPFAGSPPGRYLTATILLGWLALFQAPLLRYVVPIRLMTFAFLLMAGLVAELIARTARPDAVATPPAERPALGRPTGAWQVGRRLAVGAFVGCAFLALAPTNQFPATRETAPRFFTSAAARSIPEGSVVVTIPRDPVTHVMVWQEWSGMRFRITDGYAFVPSAPTDPTDPNRALANAINDAAAGDRSSAAGATRAELTTRLRRWRVSTVILAPMPDQDRARSRLTALLGRGPVSAGEGLYVWTNLS